MTGSFTWTSSRAYLEKMAGARDQLVAINSKGVLNAININMTGMNNHNRKVSIELKLIMIVQLGTRLLLY